MGNQRKSNNQRLEETKVGDCIKTLIQVETRKCGKMWEDLQEWPAWSCDINT